MRHRQKVDQGNVYAYSKVHVMTLKSENKTKHQGKETYSYQREIVWVDPDDAEVRVICVLAGHFLQDFQELKTI